MNMMKTQKQSDPRERIQEVANRLFYAEGVHATGTEKIMSIAEVAKATFYRHFESKDALVLAYLESRDRAFWDYLSNPIRPKDLREALTKLDQMANRPDVTSCPFLRIASEFPDPAHPFHCQVIEHQSASVQRCVEVRVRSISSKALCSIKDPKHVLEKAGEHTQAGRWIRFTSVKEITGLKLPLRSYLYEAIELESPARRWNSGNRRSTPFPRNCRPC